MWVFNWLEEVAERGRKSHCIFTYQIYLTMSNYIVLDCQRKKCLGNLFQEHNKKSKEKNSNTGGGVFVPILFAVIVMFPF